MSNYTLEVISHHPKFNSKALKKYYVDGIETVGAWGDEPFEIRFKNNTFQKVQVKLSVDGTDILTGKPADTMVSKDMWVVQAYDSISLKAWPEDNNGGAAFVFTSATNSVAVHTHGDLSSRGIIAAAVFTEGQPPEPIKLTWPRTEEHHHHHHHYPPYTPPTTWPYITTQPVWVYNNSSTTDGLGLRSKSFTSSSNKIGGSSGGFGGGGTYTSSSCNAGPAAAGSINDCFYMSDVSDGDASASLESLVAVGAGDHIDQKITYVQGLIKPVFTESVRVRYIWWDDLVEKLRSNTKAEAQPSGFPGDAKQKNIDLKGTPRLGKKGSFRRSQQERVFDRF